MKQIISTKAIIVYSVGVGFGLLGLIGTPVFAQESAYVPVPTQSQPAINDTVAPQITDTNPVIFIKQQQFLGSVVDTFLQYLSQLQTTIEQRTDIFNPAIASALLDRITQHVVVYTGYKNDIASAQSSADLRALASNLYTFRTTEGVALKRAVLSVYIGYFQRTTQQLISSRFQTIQNKIIAAKNQGKDTTFVEGVFSGAVTLMQKIDTTAHQLQNALQDPAVAVSLDDVSIALENMQKDVSSMYTLFRKITIQGDEVLELNKEENGIKGAFPAQNW